MIIKVGAFEYTEVWDGVFYKKLSRYPDITDWEMRTLTEFIEYERSAGRECTLECEDPELLETIREGLKDPSFYSAVPRPPLITECTACPHRKGCETAYVCHTAPVSNAICIFKCGRLWSAVKARGLPARQLAAESRNAANDPEDYFDYIMFTWGNCQAGDRLVMERALDRPPNGEDLSVHFKPGIRFYFKYDELVKHPGRVFDGVLPMKVKDEILLSDWVFRIIVPAAEKKKVERFIPDDLKERVLYVEQGRADIWEWSEKVYRILESEGREK